MPLFSPRTNLWVTKQKTKAYLFRQKSENRLHYPWNDGSEWGRFAFHMPFVIEGLIESEKSLLWIGFHAGAEIRFITRSMWLCDLFPAYRKVRFSGNVYDQHATLWPCPVLQRTNCTAGLPLFESVQVELDFHCLWEFQSRRFLSLRVRAPINSERAGARLVGSIWGSCVGFIETRWHLHQHKRIRDSVG